MLSRSSFIYSWSSVYNCYLGQCGCLLQYITLQGIYYLVRKTGSKDMKNCSSLLNELWKTANLKKGRQSVVMKKTTVSFIPEGLETTTQNH